MDLPKEVTLTIRKLKEAGYEAYLVGGSVRDFLINREPKDWDVTTSAEPKDIQKIFPKHFYENNFGTVTVFINTFQIEITTYRLEKGYSDKRHPDSIKYTKKLEEDLRRRDFTINAMALTSNKEIIDPFKGEIDLKEKLIRAVGNPRERFSEDALRLLRAIRFAAQLNFKIEEETKKTIKKLAKNLQFISKERIRDELIKIVVSDNPKYGFDLMSELGILEQVLPEVAKGIDVEQNKHHIYTVYEHNTRALQYAADQRYSLEVRLAALFHDVAKPQTKAGIGNNATFYNHDIVGARITKKILRRLKFSNKEIEKISLLVRYHLFYYNVDEVTESSVRRLIRKVGLENMNDLIFVRFADRIGSGTPKAEPYKLRHFKYIVDKVSRDPITVKMLKINGSELMKLLDILPSPKIGLILNALLSEVLGDASINTKEFLEKRAKELSKFSNKELIEMVKNTEKKILLLEKQEKNKFRV
jgi:poly(A) polymerase/tRNA nucleotidyltransferase (CCA-adding enzyme)